MYAGSCLQQIFHHSFIRSSANNDTVSVVVLGEGGGLVPRGGARGMAPLPPCEQKNTCKKH